MSQSELAWKYITHTLLGLYSWEWLNTIDLDLALLSGRRRFQWRLIFYLWGRYGLFGGLITVCALQLNTSSKLNCEIGCRFAALLGNTALTAASFNLSLRTMVLWEHARHVVIPLVLLILGHLAIVIRAVSHMKSVWIRGVGCVPIDIESHIYVAMYTYAVALDLIITGLTAYKLWDLSLRGRGKRQNFGRLLFRDGLVYFVVVFTVHSVAVIITVTSANPVLCYLAQPPAATIATMTACRLVRRLVTYNDQALSMTSISQPVLDTRMAYLTTIER